MSHQTYTRWTLNGQDGVDSLKCGEVELPAKLGEHDVLVKIYAASLNYRDIVLAKGAKGLAIQKGIVPGSDGAGIIISIGKSVTSFASGEKVVTHLVSDFPPDIFPTMAEINGIGLGQNAHGTIQQFGVFHESALVHMPKNLSYEQAATLTCSGLTAWNALYGGGKGPKKGDTILTQGTGGVSIAALQFASAAGATVISTTSSDAKAERLKTLGATHVINYRTDEKWGTTARSLSGKGSGISNVIDVGGLSTIAESMKAVSVGGVVTLTGVLGDSGDEVPSIMDCLWRVCSVRGVILGTRNQFKDMVKFIEETGVQPVVDEKIFGINEVKDAYKYLEEQKHFSKVVIKIA